jgi:hypothetical protein
MALPLSPYTRSVRVAVEPVETAYRELVPTASIGVLDRLDVYSNRMAKM